MAMEEHYGSNAYNIRWQSLLSPDSESTENRMRTAPLWGVRLRPRLMHDGQTLTLLEAIRRHQGEASDVVARFEELTQEDREALIEFLRSL
jgi:CxxC motif-containing protein (DUF1111 family)